jgi:hypothetical protein
MFEDAIKRNQPTLNKETNSIYSDKRIKPLRTYLHLLVILV